eukprot:CAMPEP_0202695696 /NCGR_PEP_ID=MMETSP1385-20130828/9233_1 /ASSEMBLY_ACC=CAM_ASM_000861 /TAXON_ID=933848 /ORGANISM="Elphidium margaritaceum" /LENGTH=366 /DNA_ID=CAMNT_0049351769 /DNA_START=102 /DNA_END=1202 /DNA_ORIENTATION=-
MGCLSSTPETVTNSKKADDLINKATDKYKEVEQIKYKLLLLGAGESGKSTLLKQMRMLHGRKFDNSELLAAKPHLTQNVIEGIRTLAIYSDILGDQGKNTRVSEENKEIRDRVARMSDKQKFTEAHYQDFVKLWEDPGIKETMKYHNQFQLIDTAEYLFDHMQHYWTDDYVPTFADLIHSRQRTTGVNKIRFELPDKQGAVEEVYEIFDVGGQKNERRKWMHFFDNTAAIIFVAALSGYNQLLWEDNRNNRMREAIGLFRGIVNLDVFSQSHAIMFLNKSDLFDRKVGIHSVKEHFKDFDGKEEKEPIIEFFKQKFRDQVRERRDTPKKVIHFHVTCATDSDCVQKMFESCRTIIIRQELIYQGFL